ncbi:MAG: SBBP repeat-containing protein [Ignavibacteriota bacterium]
MKTLIVSFLALAGTVHAAGTVFSTVLSGGGQEFVNAVTTDSQGNTYVAGRTYSNNFPVTAGAYQTTFGGTSDAFVAKLGPDGKIVWATFLGGTLDESANGIALDGSGNVWIAGWTGSLDFPLVNPILGANSNNSGSFAAKFDPSGAKLLFASLLAGGYAAGIAVDSGGNAYVVANAGLSTPGIAVTKLSPQGTVVYAYSQSDGAASAITVDSTGAAYVAGSTGGNSLTQTLQTFPAPAAQLALAFKLSPDGSKRLYRFTFGGSTQGQANAIAVNAAGEAWIAGSTASADFPLAHPLQSTSGARPLFQTTNGGVSFTPLDGLPFALPRALAVDPSTPSTLYEATSDLGVFKSTNGGATWTAANKGIASAGTQAIAVDPVHPETVYAASATTLYKSTDGASTWTAIDMPGYGVCGDTNSGRRAKTTTSFIRSAPILRPATRSLSAKSFDGGATWNDVPFPQSTGVAALALDPRVSGHLVAISNQVILFTGLGGSTTPAYLYRSNDGGGSWTQIQQVAQPALPSPALVADPSSSPTTFYDGLAPAQRRWRPHVVGLSIAAQRHGVRADRRRPWRHRLRPPVDTGFVVSRDHGSTWTSVAPSDPVGFYLYAAGSAGTLYGIANELGTAGFVTKLSADGSTIAYSTYLSGHATRKYGPFYASEPTISKWRTG